MATIQKLIKKRTRPDGTAEVLLRIAVTRDVKPTISTGIYVKPEYFKGEYDEQGRLKAPDIVVPNKSKLNFVDRKNTEDAQSQLRDFVNRILKVFDIFSSKEISKQLIEDAIEVSKNLSTKDMDEAVIRRLINEKYHPELKPKSFFETFYLYLQRKKLSAVREKNMKVLIKDLQRYQLYRRIAMNESSFELTIDGVTAETIEDFENYLRDESELYEEQPSIFKTIFEATDEKNKPQPRGHNTICALLNKLRAFYSWLNEQGMTDNHPFDKYSGCTTEKYGDPIYISIEERNTIADYDLSEHPQLAVQRDIFIAQCCIGCRISDLYRMTSNNIVEHTTDSGSKYKAIDYIATKTKEVKQNVISVPINNRLSTLIDKYSNGSMNSPLFPFISMQKYNDDIKDIFRLCGIDRIVTTLDPVTGNEIQKPIYEVASSHMARRCFVGGLYKQVKDPSLIAPLSGHSQNSKAFARYRKVDDDETKRQLVSLLE